MFQRVRRKSMEFGAYTFAIPLLTGVAVSLAFGYGWVAAFLIGSLLASHTLLGFPIVQALGIVANEAVTVTIGARIFTDIASLLILAICLPIHTSGFSPVPFFTQIGLLLLFIPAVLIGLGTFGRHVMARTKTKEGDSACS